MALGNKSYTYSYWQLPPGRVWVKTGDSTPFAAMVYPNLWGYQPDGIYYDDGMYSNADNNGKPLEDSIALWHLPYNASFACNSCFSVSISNTLSAHYDTNVPLSDVPLAMAAVDNDSGSYGNFGRNPVERYAYNVSNACNGVYTGIIYDIVYNAVCCMCYALVYDRSTPGTSPAGVTMATVASTINSNPDFIDVCQVRPYIYKGTETPRNNSQQIIPAQGGHTTFAGYPLVDCLTDWPIPDGETYLKSKLENGQGWRSDKVYGPYYYQLGQLLYSGSSNSISAQLDIGFMRQLTVSQIKTGANTIDSGHKITAQFYRCNYDAKYFDDVAYQWENVIFDVSNGIEIQNGMPLGNYNNSDNIRFYTRLKILDYHGNSKGKAIELAMRHEVAYLGLYFVGMVAKAQNAALGTGDGDGVYLPEIIGGVTTGRYYTGSDILSVPYATADSVSGGAFEYEPKDKGDFTSIINTGTVSGGVNYYAMTTSEMDKVNKWINTTYQPTDEDTFIQDFKGVNPADYITTVMYYPFDIELEPGADVPVSIGKLDSGAVGRKVAYKYGDLYDYGSYKIPAFNDFRDYLTKLSVFVPFCGTVDLDPILWVNHTLSVKMAIDWPTGACTAFLYRDAMIIDSISGTVGVPLPLSSVANGSYQVAITNLLASHKAAYRAVRTGALGAAGGIGTAIGGAMSGNLKLAAGGILSAAGSINAIDANSDKMENIDYNIDHTVPTVSEVSGGSPFINCGSDYRVKILRICPELMAGYDKDVYAKTTAFADCRTVKNLKAESGLCVVTNIDTSGLSAPLELIAELNRCCKEGLIV